MHASDLRCAPLSGQVKESQGASLERNRAEDSGELLPFGIDWSLAKQIDFAKGADHAQLSGKPNSACTGKKCWGQGTDGMIALALLLGLQISPPPHFPPRHSGRLSALPQ